jgi:hypothetical protein
MDFLIALVLIVSVFVLPLLCGYWIGRNQVDPYGPFGSYYRTPARGEDD